MRSMSGLAKMIFWIVLGLSGVGQIAEFSHSAEAAVAPAGRVVQFAQAMPSRFLRLPRDIFVYLPPSYRTNEQKRYPVIYMHDGQNLFEPARSVFGKIWKVKQTLDRLVATDPRFPECIVVAIDNTEDRIDEYTPVIDPNEHGGGQGANYLRFIVEELKPLVDRWLRTRPDFDSTIMAGSSLGGLFTVFAATETPQVFGRIIAMSPSVFWSNREILKRVSKIANAKARPKRVYIDTGTVLEDPESAQALADAFRAIGYRDGENLKWVVDPGSSHDETAWAKRLPEALRFTMSQFNQSTTRRRF